MTGDLAQAVLDAELCDDASHFELYPGTAMVDLAGHVANHAGWGTTIDGYAIHHGMRVWDYDLRLAVVNIEKTEWADPSSEYFQYWDGWFAMTNAATGQPSSNMNSQRMWRRHPRTGVEA
jgi:hypothetical protein